MVHCSRVRLLDGVTGNSLTASLVGTCCGCSPGSRGWGGGGTGGNWSGGVEDLLVAMPPSWQGKGQGKGRRRGETAPRSTLVGRVYMCSLSSPLDDPLGTLTFRSTHSVVRLPSSSLSCRSFGPRGASLVITMAPSARAILSTNFGSPVIVVSTLYPITSRPFFV